MRYFLAMAYFALGAHEIFLQNSQTLGVGQMFRHNYFFFNRSECQLFQDTSQN